MVSLAYMWQHPDALRRARFHVQLEIEDVSDVRPPLPDRTGIVLVKGRVTRTFRTDESLRLGSAAHFEVWVHGDRPRHMGNVIMVARDWLAAQKHLEVVLDGDPPVCRLLSFREISAPSRTPILRLPSRLQCWWIRQRSDPTQWLFRFLHRRRR